MKYISTRGRAPELSFEEVVLAGLAEDGGLYVPEEIPHFTPQTLAGLAALPYDALALEIIRPYVNGELTDEALETLIGEAYGTFRHTAIAPLKQLDGNHWLLELFHGPTLAFKDFALQFLGRLVDHILIKHDRHVVVLGATSGDTGSAALAGCRGRERMQNFILFPDGRVSDVQRRQMTTLTDDNIHTIAVKGTFDDCQDMVKTLFADADFRTKHHLVAVNSINWARILAQIVYYFYAALRLGAPAREVSFSVPTGNFGDIFAGYIAKRMGLPIHSLIIATNRNDILARCHDSASYSMQGVVPTLSPSMDIQISSNFERLMFDLYDRDAGVIREMMTRFRTDQSFTLSATAWQHLKRDFKSHATDDATTLETIKRIYKQTGELLDPHTATGVNAARHCHDRTDIPVITLATAHPAKFPDAVTEATGIHPALPAHLSDLFEREERFTPLENNVDAVKAFIEEQKR